MPSTKQATKNSLVFFGTGQTSLDSLKGLNSEFSIELVITKPPAKNSAGKEFLNPVHTWAQQNNLQIITPASKSELQSELGARKLNSKLAVVLDYGMIIPKSVIDMFPLGILNSHFSLLPKYRGANPIRAAILSGDKTTGITIIKITPQLDDGPILTWALVDTNDDDAPSLRARLSDVNCPLLCETIRLYLSAQLDAVAQDESEASYTHKTTKEDGLIDPQKSAAQLEREVRAYAVWPKSYLIYNGKPLIIIEAKDSSVPVKSDQFEVVDGNLHYGCKNGSLVIKMLQPAGKAVMDYKAFINGYLNSL